MPILDQAQLTDQAGLLAEVAGPAGHAQVCGSMRATLGDGYHVVESDLAPLEELVAQIADASVACDDLVAVNALGGDSCNDGTTARGLLGTLSRPRIVLALVGAVFGGVRLHAHVVAHRLCSLFVVSTLVLKQSFSVLLAPLGCALFDLFGVRKCVCAGSRSRAFSVCRDAVTRVLPTASSAHISRPARVEIKIGQCQPFFTFRALAQFLSGADVEYVLLGLKLRILSWLVRIPDLVARLAIGSQSTTAVLLQRLAKIIEWQPFSTEAAMLQPEGVIHRGASLHVRPDSITAERR